MTNLTAQQYLNTLCQCVKSSIVPGGFLLSTGEVSNYWLPIDRLRTYQATNAIKEILRLCLPNFQRETKVETVFVPKLTTTTADTFPLDIIINELYGDITNISTKKALNFCSVNFNQYGQVVEIPEGAPSGRWLGIFTISVHVNLITSILDELHRRERIVEYVLVIIERDRVTRQHLERQGVSLVPLLICDEHTGEPMTILDMKRSPYIDYHKYFVGS